MSRGLSLILFTPAPTSKANIANKNPFAHDYSSVVVIGASGSLGIVRFEKQTDGTRRAGADPDVESGFKELIKCCPKYTTLF